MDYFLSDKFKARAEALMAKYHVPGLAIAITHNERIESLAFGLATLDPPTPCTTDTLFDIASASKSMTAASVAMLVEDERYPEVQYDGIVSDMLPDDFVMPTEELTKQVTLDDILSHRSGMTTHDFSYLGVYSKTPDTARSVVRNLRNLPMSEPLRTKWIYNNMMYTTLAHLVETKSGGSLSDFLEANFFRPLGMASSSLQPSRARAKGFGPRLATGYNYVRGKQHQAPVPMVECPEADGAGSIITSVNDYIKWVHALLHQQAPVVTKKRYGELLRARAIIDANDCEGLMPHTSPTLYCAGLETDYYRGHQRVSHSGGVTGFLTEHLFFPAQKFGAVMVTNGADEANLVLKMELIDEVLQVPEADRTDWEAYMDKFYNDTKREPDNVEAKLRKEIFKDLSGDSKDAKDDEEDKKEEEEPALEPQPLTTPLETYAGTYTHPGYHTLELEIKDGELYVDAEERSFGFTGVFHHVAEQTHFTMRVAESTAWGGQDDYAYRAEFTLEDGRVTKLGLDLDESLNGEMIWFTRK